MNTLSLNTVRWHASPMLLLAWYCLLQYASANAADQDPIKLGLNGEYRLRPVDIPTVALVPIILPDGLPATKIELAVQAVRIDKIYEANLLSAFQIDPPNPVVEKAGAAFISLQVKRPLKQGVYDLVIRARAVDQVKPIQQSLTLQISYPEATVRATGDISVSRVIGINANNIKQTIQPLIMEEVGGVTAVKDGRIQHAFQKPSLGTSVTGVVSGPNTPITIDAGKSTELVLSINGSFPLGDAIIPIELASSQLKMPVPITVKVSTRRTYTWLWIATLLGLGLGWATRYWLKDMAERNGLRVQAYDFEKRLVLEQERYPDRTYCDSLRQVREKLLTAASSQNISSSDFTAMISASKKELDTAQTDLKDRITQRTVELTKWEECLGRAWWLPGVSASLLNNARHKLVEATRDLENMDADKAKQSLTDLRGGLEQRMTDIMTDWTEPLRRTLSNVVSTSNMFPAPIGEWLKSSAEKLLAEIPVPPETNKEWNPESTRGFFSAIDSYRRKLHHEINVLINTVDQFFQAMILPFEGVPAADSVREALQACVQDFSRRLQGDPEAAWATVSMERGALARTLQAILTSAMPASDATTKAKLEQLLSEGKFVDAAILLANALTLRNLDLPARQQSLPQSPPALTINQVRPENEKTLPDPAGFGLHFAPGAVKPIELPDAQARARYRFATTVQWLIGCIGIITLSYLTFGASYVGTFQEMVAIFIWAFGLDITVDALVSKIQGMKLKA